MTLFAVSQGAMQALFLRHEGYLGAIGAFLKRAEEEGGYNCLLSEHKGQILPFSEVPPPLPKEVGLSCVSVHLLQSSEIAGISSYYTSVSDMV